MDAEETTQDVFLSVFEKSADFRNEADMKTWIYRITVNRCIDRLRRYRRQEFLSLLLPFDVAETDFSRHPGLKMESDEEVNRLLIAINKLPDRQKTALILNKLEGMSVLEVAQVMKLEHKATESLIFRGKESLKKILSKSNDC